MHLNEIDFRATPLRTLCTSSTNAISDLIKLSKEPGILDGLTAMEYAEYFLGAVLVACQAYAVGTVSDINKIRISADESELDKLALYKLGRKSGVNYTSVELINSLANFFKHNEEWDAWPENHTTKTLRYYGVNETTDFPLYSGIGKIIGDSTDLRELCRVLEDWRFLLIHKYCSC